MTNEFISFAATYTRMVRETLEPHELEAVQEGASEHDFYDANETVVEAFEKVFGREPLLLADADTAEAQEEIRQINEALEGASRLLAQGIPV